MDSRAQEDDNGPESMSFGEPAPEPNDGPSMHDLVIEDMKARKQFGLGKYGTPLQAHNGRKPLKDAYEEMLDHLVYLRQEMEERKFVPIGHTAEPKPEHITVEDAADGLIESMDSIAEELPGIHEAVGNRIGRRHLQQHGTQMGTVPLHPESTVTGRIKGPSTLPLKSHTGINYFVQVDNAAKAQTQPREKKAMVLDPEVVEVQEELVRQEAKWGEQNHPDGTGTGASLLGMSFEDLSHLAKRHCDEEAKAGRVTWRHILLEEVFEAMAESDEEKLLAELNQVAAVAAQWRKAIHRRQARRAAAPELGEFKTLAERNADQHENWAF